MAESEWRDFYAGRIWSALLWELKDREDYLVDLFKENDPVWTADIIRGKLTELEYIRQIPSSIIASILVKESNLKNQKEAENGRED